MNSEMDYYFPVSLFIMAKSPLRFRMLSLIRVLQNLFFRYDVVQGLFDGYEPGDQLRFMTGIGGREASVRRKIHRVQFYSFQMDDFPIDFGHIGEDTSINGLIGLDILIPGQFILDLGRLQICAAAHDE